MLTEAERDALLQAAWDLNEYVPPVVDGPTRSSHNGHSLADYASAEDAPRGDLFYIERLVTAIEQAGRGTWTRLPYAPPPTGR